jgi:hypothetical protein
MLRQEEELRRLDQAEMRKEKMERKCDRMALLLEVDPFLPPSFPPSLPFFFHPF